jgi:hypothetical protein
MKATQLVLNFLAQKRGLKSNQVTLKSFIKQNKIGEIVIRTTSYTFFHEFAD